MKINHSWSFYFSIQTENHGRQGNEQKMQFFKVYQVIHTTQNNPDDSKAMLVVLMLPTFPPTPTPLAHVAIAFTATIIRTTTAIMGLDPPIAEVTH